MSESERELQIPRKRQRKAQSLGAMSVPNQETDIIHQDFNQERKRKRDSPIYELQV